MASAHPKLVLIGWDGADWGILRPLLAQGHLPNLQNLLRTAWAGDLMGHRPMLSSVSWTTLTTGAPPHRHKIFDENSTRCTPTLWDHAAAQGHLTHSVHFPADRSDLPGFHTGRLTGPRPENIPEALWVRAPDITPQMLTAILPRALDLLAAKDPRAQALREILALTARTHAITTYALEHHPATLTAAIYPGIELTSQLFMHYAAPQLPALSAEDFTTFSPILPNIYKLHDALLGRILQLTPQGTDVVLTSPYGFATGPSRPPQLPKDEWQSATLHHRRRGVLILPHDPGVPELDITALTPHLLQRLNLKPAAPPPQPDPTIAHLLALGYTEPDLPPTNLVARHQWATRRQVHIESLLSAGLAAQALPLARELADSLLTQPEYQALFIESLYRTKRYKEMGHRLTLLCRQGQTGPLLSLGLALYELSQNRPQKALVHLDSIDQATPEVHELQGDAYQALRQYPQAKTAYTAALEKDSMRSASHTGLARIAIAERHYNQALEHALEAITLDPHTAETHLALGLAFLQLNQLAQADTALRRALSLDPKNEETLEALAGLNTSDSRDFHAQLTHLRYTRSHSMPAASWQ